MIELTACPPSAGNESTSATLRPRRAASSAAETPEMPAPSTQISADTCCGVPPAGRRTILVAVEIFALSVLILSVYRRPVDTAAQNTDFFCWGTSRPLLPGN